ncbi:hypothetical protein HK096_011668, partial [Nowakowskiella sp. JEL0078]
MLRNSSSEDLSADSKESKSHISPSSSNFETLKVLKNINKKKEIVNDSAILIHKAITDDQRWASLPHFKWYQNLRNEGDLVPLIERKSAVIEFAEMEKEYTDEM